MAGPENTKTTEQDWIDTATQMLVEQSIDSVRVEPLAAKLGVTKGSFYSRFKDRDDLLRQLLAAWRKRATESVIEKLEKRSDSPRERLIELLGLPFHSKSAAHAASVEIAIRAWARRDPMARAAVDEVDLLRVRYVTSLFRDLGFGQDQADAKAYLFHCLLLGESLFRFETSADKQAARRHRIEEMLFASAEQEGSAANRLSPTQQKQSGR